MTAPASVAASCGVDAFIHALEAYISNFATPFTDAMAEKSNGIDWKQYPSFCCKS